MKKVLKKFKGILLVGLMAALLSTSAYGQEVSDDLGNQSEETTDYGMYSYCVATGEVTYIPPDETEAYSDETEGFSPGYNPFADEENDDLSPQPYYMRDNRVKVNNPQNDARCRNTVRIEGTTKSGKKIFGSGFMIGPNAVATCGHMLCDNGYGSDNSSWEWLESAKVTPAMNSGTNPEPYGTANSTYLYCGGSWAKDLDRSDDWGIIELDSNIGYSVGWLGLRYQSGSYSGDAINVNGYPWINGNSNNLYISYGTVRDSESRLLYSRSNYISYGDSGGPCYIDLEDNGYTAIGISLLGLSDVEGSSNITDSVFRRIDKRVYNEFVAFRTSTL